MLEKSLNNKRGQNDTLLRLENWYLQQCNGEWEHSFGLKLQTLDNPGWHLVIDLVGTAVENATFEPVKIDRADDDWIDARIKGKTFEGAGGPRNLDELLSIFLGWADGIDAT